MHGGGDEDEDDDDNDDEEDEDEEECACYFSVVLPYCICFCVSCSFTEVALTYNLGFPFIAVFFFLNSLWVWGIVLHRKLFLSS